MKYIQVALLVVSLWSGVSSSDEDQFPMQVETIVRRVRMPEEKMRSIPGLLQELETILSKNWPGCKINLLGSMAYGLAMAYSDVDCIVSLPDHNSTSYESLWTVLEQTKKLLEQYPDFKNFISWTNITVPVLTFDHVPLKIDIDISFNTENELRRSRMVKFMLLLDKRAYYLAFVTKYWARYNTMDSQILLRNHGMILLAIFYLQQMNVLPSIASLQENATAQMIDEWNFGFDEKSYERQNNETLTSIIGGFFTYYRDFDYDSYIVSTYAGYPIKKSAFKRIETVPAEFVLYKENVLRKKSQPLDLTKDIMVQDMFVHNQYINNSLDTMPDSPFVELFEDAARRFKEDKTEFFKDMQRGKSYAQRVIRKLKRVRARQLIKLQHM